MEDNLSSLINNWEGGQNSTVEELRADLLALTSVYLGLGGATFILVFCVLHKKLALLCCSGRHVQLKSFQNVHTFFFALLIMDVVHVAVTAVYMTDLVNDCDVFGANSCLSNHSVWILSRYFMVVLLLIAALMSIRYLCDPPSEGKLCCMGPLVFVLFVAFASVYVFLTPYIVIILGPVTIGLIFAIIFKTRCSKVANWRTLFSLFFIVILSFLFFLPSFVLHCLVITRLFSVTLSVYYYVQFCTNVQFFFDALFCCFILVLPMDVLRRTPGHQHGDIIVGGECFGYGNYGYGYHWGGGCCGDGDCGDGCCGDGDCGDGCCGDGDCDIGDCCLLLLGD
ncbi:uncharacterized protein V6R79_010141 [Siganus canaliculatus]